MNLLILCPILALLFFPQSLKEDGEKEHEVNTSLYKLITNPDEQDRRGKEAVRPLVEYHREKLRGELILGHPADRKLQAIVPPRGTPLTLRIVTTKLMKDGLGKISAREVVELELGKAYMLKTSANCWLAVAAKPRKDMEWQKSATPGIILIADHEDVDVKTLEWLDKQRTVKLEEGMVIPLGVGIETVIPVDLEDFEITFVEHKGDFALCGIRYLGED